MLFTQKRILTGHFKTFQIFVFLLRIYNIFLVVSIYLVKHTRRHVFFFVFQRVTNLRVDLIEIIYCSYNIICNNIQLITHSYVCDALFERKNMFDDIAERVYCISVCTAILHLRKSDYTISIFVSNDDDTKIHYVDIDAVIIRLQLFVIYTVGEGHFTKNIACKSIGLCDRRGPKVEASKLFSLLRKHRTKKKKKKQS